MKSKIQKEKGREITGLSKAGYHDASSVIEQIEIGGKKISWRYVVME